MARSFAGGTDIIRYGEDGWSSIAVGTVAFWFKTTQATANAVPLSIWNSSSRVGLGFLLNNTANKLTIQCYGTSGTPAINLTSSATVNDGNWHHAALVYNRASGSANTFYVDGAVAGSANAGEAWSGTATPFILGNPVDAFWPSYVGEMAEVAHWFRQLNAAEIAALAKGFSPKLFPRVNLYAPLVRSVNGVTNPFIHSVSGTTVTPHPRVIGGSI